MNRQRLFQIAHVLVLVLGCLTYRAAGQNQLQMAISGSAATTDDTGKIISIPISNHSLIQDFANANGITDISWLGLAYHIRGNDLGDTIEVINRTNGTPVYTVFGLYFGEDSTLGRAGLLSGSGRQMRRVEYVYTDQNSHSMGSAYLVNYYYFDSNGNTNKTYVLGNMQWVLLPTAIHTNVQVCTATLSTYRPWTFSGQ